MTNIIIGNIIALIASILMVISGLQKKEENNIIYSNYSDNLICNK